MKSDKKLTSDNKLKRRILRLRKMSNILQKKNNYGIVIKLYKKLNYIKFFEKLLKNDFKTQVFELISKLKFRKYEKNDIIFLQYTKPIKFYTIVEGQVLVLIKNKSNYSQNKLKFKMKKNSKSNLDFVKNDFFSKLKKKKTEFNLEIDNKNNNFDKEDFLEKFENDPFFFDQKTGQFLHQLVAVLKKGDSFGELGIMNKCNRLASIITTQKTELGELSSKNFEMIIKKSIFTEIDSKLKYLKSWLKDFCSSNDIFIIGAYFKKLEAKKGEYIFKEKTKFNKLFLMAGGEIILEKKNIKERENGILFNSKIDYFKKIPKSVF